MEEYVKKHDVQACLEQLAAEHLIGNDFDTFISLPEAQDKIEELTAVEVEPVRHGKWIWINQATGYLEPPYGDTCKCSECEFIIDVSETHFKYCPNCGTKMLKEEI